MASDAASDRVQGEMLTNGDVLPFLTCSVCQEVMENPVRGCDRGHHFCAECLHKWFDPMLHNHRKCPDCRDDLAFSKDVHNNFVTGVPAPLIAGLIRVQEVACPHACGETCKAFKLKDHKETCRRAPVECPFAALGCEAKIPREEVDAHVRDATHQHQLLICKNFAKTEEQMVAQCREVEDLRRDVKWATQRVTCLRDQVESEFSKLTSNVHALSEKQDETNSLLRDLVRLTESNINGFAEAVEKTKGRGKRKAAAIDEALENSKKAAKKLSDTFSYVDRDSPVSYSPRSPSYSPTSPAYAPEADSALVMVE